jgi:O-antigen/teichoic acid export membrane protein
MKFLPADILSKNTVVTISTKFTILLANFIIVVVSANLWGSSGRGEIALIIANIAIITILSNITCGSTIAFYAPKENRDLLLVISLAGSFILSLSGSLIFSLSIGFSNFLNLFIISLLSSLTGSVSMYWLGRNNIKLYNILTLINPVLVLFFLLTFYFVFEIKSIQACFYAYYAGLGVLLITGIMSILRTSPFRVPKIAFNDLAKIVKYGFNNEFNYFIQFLNYRLSYFFIAKFLGLSQLGVFSIAISCAEAVWVISKSMSALHYSNVLNTTNQNNSISATTVFARQSFWISLLFLGLLVLLPKSLFEFIFGVGFGDIKTYLIYLFPGIIAIAVSNLHGHYFAGIGKLYILRNKSLIGLSATLILLILLTKNYQLTGVCISLNVSYILSSFYLFFKFRLEKNKSFKTTNPNILENNKIRE